MKCKGGRRTENESIDSNFLKRTLVRFRAADILRGALKNDTHHSGHNLKSLQAFPSISHSYNVNKLLNDGSRNS